ncbi:MAG: hypothetical protein UX79_C0003G0026 [candidate division WWE3 bacterium GW2011_GWB1_47_11]|uniref:Uncharacterized protein n=2 Tax=Katanobacteria TaxID=422282 RepID=A0A0G1RLE0_UNCKA|nr:MAG: hypothetical protein UX69_C0003G0004 [candidate division WWE3 bacterium GW2011_GWA2_46_9]KKU57956.1 MAG: hypothetical protein UX79_C0003G0026 [candidate division WWE3 bacterium GW2011_GWB1_47_11]
MTRESLEAARDLNPTSVFVGASTLDAATVTNMRKVLDGAEIYAEVGIFVGQALIDKYPDAKPVEAFGKATAKDWYVGVCPTHPGVRKDVLEKIKSLTKLGVDGIWLDFIRYPSKWEEPRPYILDTCYCPRCMSLFEEFIGEKLVAANLEELALLIDGSYYHEWLQFKAGQITSLVKETRKLIDESGKKITLGLFAVPWRENEYGAGIKRIVAQDFGALAELVDVFSPMLYHKMCGKDVAWIKEMVAYFWHVNKQFLPLIQTESRVAEITAHEFEQALCNASASPSMGVCVFFLEDLLKQPEKSNIVKDYFAKN